ncbi:hypothetical protein FPZ12_018855 [Amycolatopsis acidicola]|uniref:Uncharacterized protein n=1 Tax=Amycolatopsis acidicola TaxID=2596893 RepID=A0A5N0V4F2_9PSEU|nr:hypothetical protein [Amycolatopsis acidicola]KAA9159953.1 hypothetical protein FPZ12_018855 [Amycolatopsis acidicola]
MSKKTVALTGMLAGLAAVATVVPAQAVELREGVCYGQLNIAGRDFGTAIEWGGLYTCDQVSAGPYDADWSVSSDGAVIASGKFQPVIGAQQQTPFPVVHVNLPGPVPHAAKHVKVQVVFNAKIDPGIMSTEQDVYYSPPD